jgi:hypothetical protein
MSDLGAVAADKQTTSIEDAAALVREVAWRLMPLIMICYLFAFFDRINFSFAKFQLQTDLGFSKTAYGLGASLFVVGYVIFEVPSNMLLFKVGARRWVARIHDLVGPRDRGDGVRAYRMAVLRFAFSDWRDGSGLRPRRAVLPDAVVSDEFSRAHHVAAVSRVRVLRVVRRAAIGPRARQHGRRVRHSRLALAVSARRPALHRARVARAESAEGSR